MYIENKNYKNGRRARTPEYMTWQSIRGRCNNPNGRDYHRYGGRGITVCSRWDVYAQFLEDMGRRPHVGLSIDRIDNDSGYRADNCRWATTSEQNLNKRTNPKMELNGEAMTITEWAQRAGCKPGLVRGRLRLGWTLERALTESSAFRTLEFDGEKLTLGEWADRVGCAPQVLHARLRRGWSTDRIVTTPVSSKRFSEETGQ